jgi:hypothetical protein
MKVATVRRLIWYDHKIIATGFGVWDFFSLSCLLFVTVKARYREGSRGLGQALGMNFLPIEFPGSSRFFHLRIVNPFLGRS